MAEQWEDLGLRAWIESQQTQIFGGRKVLPDSHVDDDDATPPDDKPNRGGRKNRRDS